MEKKLAGRKGKSRWYNNGNNISYSRHIVIVAEEEEKKRVHKSDGTHDNNLVLYARVLPPPFTCRCRGGRRGRLADTGKNQDGAPGRVSLVRERPTVVEYAE
jgi:hypothetical protein